MPKEMTKEQRKTAGEVHKNFFDRTQFAINNQFYLEAILLEYSAMETRLRVILGLFDMPCSACEDTDITNRIGLQTKLKCFKHCMDENPDFFAKSKINRTTLKKMAEWCNSRNRRIHGLYEDTEKYGALMGKNKKLAETGYEYAYMLYNEANRLKRLKKNHPDVFSTCNFTCFNPYQDCIKAAQWKESNNSSES